MNYKFIQNVQIDWTRIGDSSYIRNIPSLQFEDALVFEKNRTKNYNFSTYDSHSNLHEAIRLGKGVYKPEWSYFLRAESFYNVATKEEEYSDWAHPSQQYHKIHECSYTETDSYQVTEMFINNREYLLKRLLRD